MNSQMRLTPTGPGGTHTGLAVEGWIVNEHADLLETECIAILGARRTLELDLSGVSYVDARGAATLRRLRRRGVEIVGCPPFILEFVYSSTGSNRSNEGGKR